MEEQIERIRRAWEDKGNHPEYHDEQILRLQRDWPTLYRAIMALLATGDTR